MIKLATLYGASRKRETPSQLNFFWCDTFCQNYFGGQYSLSYEVKTCVCFAPSLLSISLAAQKSRPKDRLAECLYIYFLPMSMGLNASTLCVAFTLVLASEPNKLGSAMYCCIWLDFKPCPAQCKTLTYCFIWGPSLETTTLKQNYGKSVLPGLFHSTLLQA